jgi:hypothetical protein
VAFRYTIVFGYKLVFEYLRSTTKTRYTEPAFFFITRRCLKLLQYGPLSFMHESSRIENTASLYLFFIVLVIYIYLHTYLCSF